MAADNFTVPYTSMSDVEAPPTVEASSTTEAPPTIGAPPTTTLTSNDGNVQARPDPHTINDETQRKRLTIADDTIGEYRLKKLKFLLTPLVKVDRVKDDSSVVDMYNTLKIQHGGDCERAASELYEVLELVGMEDFSSSSGDSSHGSQGRDIWQEGDFGWRAKLIQHLGKVEKQKRDSELIDRLYASYDIAVGRDSVTSPFMLFEYMVEHGLFVPGEEKDLKAVEEVTNCWNKSRCIKLTLLLFALAFLLLSIGALLSLLMFARFRDLSHFRSVFFNSPVTVMAGMIFNLQYYDSMMVSITSSGPTHEYSAALCQTNCNNLTAILPLNFEGKMNSFSNLCFLPFPGFEPGIAIPTIFMLKGSYIRCQYRPVMGTPLNLTVKLHIFVNARDCNLFSENKIDTSPKNITLREQEDFIGTYNSTADDYVCIVVEFDQAKPSFYEFVVNATIHQYHNVSYLQDQGLCINRAIKTLSSDDDSISIGLNRSSVAVKQQSTCVLLSLDGALCRSVFSVSSTTFATNGNIGVISLSAVGGIASILVLVFAIFLAISLRCTCKLSTR